MDYVCSVPVRMFKSIRASTQHIEQMRTWRLTMHLHVCFPTKPPAGTAF